MEIHASKLGSVCGVNPFESRDLCILEQRIKKNKNEYKRKFMDLGLIVLTTFESENITKRLKTVYNKHSSTIKNPSDFNKTKTDIIEEIKKTSDLTNKNISLIKDIIDSDMKKDCGKNNEPIIISNNKYKKGNSRLWQFKFNNECIIKGFHDATNGDIVIEIKTRMKESNVRKNKYDLYQLFGYLMLMNKQKGKIVQYYNNKTFDSDVETNNEYGVIDIKQEKWTNMYDTFLKELKMFCEDVKNKEITFEELFGGVDKPIANIDVDGVYCNINPRYESLIKSLY